MKYLKYFLTEAEYAAYKNGGDFITPNVSYTVDTAKVFYNPNTDNSSDTIIKYININAYDISCSLPTGEFLIENALYNNDGIFITDTPIKSLKLYPKTANSSWSDIVLIKNDGTGEVLNTQSRFTWDSETGTATATEEFINMINITSETDFQYCTLAFMIKSEDLGTVFMDSIETVIEYTI